MENNNSDNGIEDEHTIRRLVSRLCFIRSDLEAVEKLNIKSEEIKQIVKAMKSRVDLLMDIFFPKRKEFQGD